MEGVSSSEEVSNNRSLNQQQSPFDFTNKSSIIPAKLTANPTSREASFSSYLKSNVCNKKHHPQDSEISISEAEKYFKGLDEPRGNNNNNNNNEGMYIISNPKQSDTSTIARLSSVLPTNDDYYGRHHRARSFHGTPAASSEASWNSQTGLLTNYSGLAPSSIRSLPSAAGRTSKKTGISMKWFLQGSKCPCSGRKSVDVSESNSDGEASKIPPSSTARLNRSRSGGGSLYSSKQSTPTTLAHPIKGTTTAPPTTAAATATVMPNEPTENFIARPQLDQAKLFLTSKNPSLTGFHGEKSFPPDQVAATVRTIADDSGATSNGFTFPILKESTAPPKRMLNVERQFTDGCASAGETPRDSLEVFQPRDDVVSKTRGGGRNCAASPKCQWIYDDEMCSDASSDLFEIESFSPIQTTSCTRRESLDYQPLRRLQIATINKTASVAGRESPDEEEALTPSIAPTECYPPSEVSVDWSVTTVEGFDGPSLAGFDRRVE